MLSECAVGHVLVMEFLVSDSNTSMFLHILSHYSRRAFNVMGLIMLNFRDWLIDSSNTESYA